MFQFKYSLSLVLSIFLMGAAHFLLLTLADNYWFIKSPIDLTIFLPTGLGVGSCFILIRHFERVAARTMANQNIAHVDEGFIRALIESHENQTTELKSSFNRDMSNRGLKVEVIRHAAIKTLAGLQNTTGGYLILGVQDDGHIIGVSEDLKSFSRDKYERAFLDVCQSALDPFQAAHISCCFVKIDGKDVFVVNVTRPKILPVYVKMPKINDGHELFVRRGAATVSLSAKEAIEFERSRSQEKL